MQKDEKNAINKFLKDSAIKVISLSDFEKDTLTDVSRNEYVLFPNGVYMQIVSRGSGEKIKNRDEILVRYKEYNIMHQVEGFSNYNVDNVDSFTYNFITESHYGGTFNESYLQYCYLYYYGVSIASVMEGWLFPLRYLKDMAHIRLIVPHKQGHEYSLKYVEPYFYEIYKYQIY